MAETYEGAQGELFGPVSPGLAEGTPKAKSPSKSILVKLADKFGTNEAGMIALRLGDV